ncbi:MAG: hypothetical protein AAF647_13385 [Pseudomonadota bacterium]
MIEIEVQNETHQTQMRIRFAAVPRIGEGIRLREPDGMWASYDVLDVLYQKAEFGDVWMPYLHVRMTPGELGGEDIEADGYASLEPGGHSALDEDADYAAVAGEAEPFKI